MLYSLIRIIIVLIICFVVLYIVIKKTNLFKKHKTIRSRNTKSHSFLKCFMIMCIVSLLDTALYMWPFENLFIDFSSPEDVFKYTTTGDIDKILYGDNSCMIIYTNDNSKDIMFARKDDNGYKIVTYPQYSKECLVPRKHCFTDMYKLNQTEDTYCCGYLIHDTNDIDLSDNYDTEYCVFHIDDKVYYYGYLKNYNGNYSLYVNSN